MQLALFPIHTVLLRKRGLSLRIFEPHYRVMLRACIDEDVSSTSSNTV